jgi:KDO2-lipid IV(A) lauroyltransferase
MGIGRLAGRIALSRRRVALRNIEICLPELCARERERIVSVHFGYLGVALLTQGLVWGVSRRRLRRLVTFQNRELIDGLIGEGRNIILMVPHFVALEVAGPAFAALIRPGVFMYQKIRNPVLDAQMRAQRSRFGSVGVERSDDLRRTVRHIRAGSPFFYLPDQNANKRTGIFVPFCGIQASTVPMLGRFARMGNAVVVPTYGSFLPWGRGIQVAFDPPPAGFPSGDPAADTATMNRVIEKRLRTMPAQYFWVHRRFKTRPPGEPPIYPSKMRRSRRRRG